MNVTKRRLQPLFFVFLIGEGIIMKFVTIAALSILALPLMAQQKPTPMPTEPPKSSVMTADQIYTMAASISVAHRLCNSAPKLQETIVYIYYPSENVWQHTTCSAARQAGMFGLDKPDFINEYEKIVDEITTAANRQK